MIPFAEQPYPWLSWLLAGAAVVLVGIAKSGFGGGVGIAAVPLMIFAFGRSEQALGTLLPILVTADVLSVWHHWGRWDGKNLKVIAPGTLAGVVVGSAGLAAMLSMDGADPMLAQSQRWMKTAIGVICVLYVAAEVVRHRYAGQWRMRCGWAGGTVTGLVAGVTSTFAHAAGPVTAIYWLSQQLPKSRFVGTAVVYFFVLNVVKLLPYGLLGLIDGRTLVWGLWLVPLVPVGTWSGARLHGAVSEKVFYRVVMGIVLLSGLQMLGRQVL